MSNTEANAPTEAGRIEVEPTWGKHLVGLDGLRALAAVGVLVTHAGGIMYPGEPSGAVRLFMILGEQGLTLFFALSGFLLYRPFARALLTGAPLPQMSRYARNRVLRIYPAYIVILLITALVIGTANTAPLSTEQSERAERVGYLTDPLVLFIDATLTQPFFPSTMQTGIGVAWSLTVELVFYLVMPLLALAAHSVFRRASLLVALVPAVILLAVGLSTRALSAPLFAGLSESQAEIAEWGNTWTAVLARSFPFHADLFVFGMIAAVLIERLRFSRLSPSRVRVWRLSAVMIAAVALAGAVTVRIEPSLLFALAAGSALFFVSAPTKSGGVPLLSRVLDFAPNRYIGLISYSVYLWHVSVIWLLVRFDFVVPGTSGLALLANIAVVLALTVGLASVTYFAIERPALRLKKRPSQMDLREAPQTSC